MFSQYILPAIIGLASGTIGAFIATWANWGIEKKHIKLNNQFSLLQDVRNDLDNTGNYLGFSQTTQYSRIRCYLSEGLRKRIELATTKDDDANFHIEYRELVLNELSTLEKKWNLS